MEGFKSKNLMQLINTGHNVHSFYTLTSIGEVKEYIQDVGELSVRFDTPTEQFDLPYYLLHDYEEIDWGEIEQRQKQYDATFLCSDGCKHNSEQLCNLKFKKDFSGNFLVELSFSSVPLRHMYRYGTVVLKGNFMSPTYDLSSNSRDQLSKISKTIANKILNYVLAASDYNVWCECTLYPRNVGVLQQEIVYWQIHT